MFMSCLPSSSRRACQASYLAERPRPYQLELQIATVVVITRQVSLPLLKFSFCNLQFSFCNQLPSEPKVSFIVGVSVQEIQNNVRYRLYSDDETIFVDIKFGRVGF